MTTLTTSRLRLEPISGQHLHGLHAVNGDAQVMERLGMRYRGLERWYDSDCATYEMTRDEWLAQGA